MLPISQSKSIHWTSMPPISHCDSYNWTSINPRILEILEMTHPKTLMIFTSTPSPPGGPSDGRAAGSANRDGAWTSHDPLSRSGARPNLASTRRDASPDDTPTPTSDTSRRTSFRDGDSSTTASASGRDPPARARSCAAPIASAPHARELATSAVTSAPRNIPNPVARATNVERPDDNRFEFSIGSTLVQFHFVGRRTPRGAGRDAVDLAAERESDPRRVWRSRGHGAGRRGGGDEAGDEAEGSPSHEGAVRARGEVSVEMQGVRCLSAREEALSVQGVRWCINLRARS